MSGTCKVKHRVYRNPATIWSIKPMIIKISTKPNVWTLLGITLRYNSILTQNAQDFSQKLLTYSTTKCSDVQDKMDKINESILTKTEQ